MNPNDGQNNQMPYYPNNPHNTQGGQNDDMFPSFLNDPSNVQGDFDPSQMSGASDDGMGGQESQDKQQVVGGGAFSPEISGGGAVVESQPKAVEYGTEVQPSVEVPEIEQVENKEKKPIPQEKPEVPEKPAVIEKPKEIPADHQAPALFGYVVSPQVMQNFNAIRKTKEKGAPDSTKTWLYVLLDRLLKMHSQKPS